MHMRRNLTRIFHIRPTRIIIRTTVIMMETLAVHNFIIKKYRRLTTTATTATTVAAATHSSILTATLAILIRIIRDNVLRLITIGARMRTHRCNNSSKQVSAATRAI